VYLGAKRRYINTLPFLFLSRKPSYNHCATVLTEMHYGDSDVISSYRIYAVLSPRCGGTLSEMHVTVASLS